MKQIIKGYALWLWYYLYKPYRNKMKTEAERKIQICEKCNSFNETFRMCNLCGCFMDIKTKSAEIEDCLDRKW